MEKLSKSIINNDILKKINFSGFSSSLGWIGYFERKGKFSLDLIDESIKLFDSFFSSSKNSMTISALSFDDTRIVEDDIEKKYGEIYKKYIKKELVFPLNDEYESYLYGDIEFPVSLIKYSKDKDIFIDLSKLLMCYNKLLGQICFYIDLDYGLAVYPHDDIGFGCIVLNDNYEVGYEFLNSCKKNGEFDVYIQKNI